ncbi:MAG: TRAP transporter large permease [Deltaproteobacteria bacterium]|nr:TRAP transporter large permease [Deltaproteobacteria bacterium]MBW1994409.1 TRAP transporter large permease [Deltaproteobacteria bacterium]MBW2154432.1 TRAP transporter large permease [Deltaproteobacteria bacterium]
MLFILFGALIVLFISGIPIAFALFIASLIYLILSGEFPLYIVAQKFIAGPDSFTLLAIPLFVAAGALMNTTGITKRIFDLARALVGHLSGGLGHVNIVASIIFSGMSGAAMADAAGLGLIEIKAMREAGYDDDFSIAVTASSSIIGPIIPPSVPAVIYGTVASVSVGALFLGGIIPGLLMGLSLMVLVTIFAKRRNYPRHERVSLKGLIVAFQKGFLPVMTPVIIIGGIWTGWFTPTEAAGVACVYAVLLGLYYRELTFKLFIEVIGQIVYVSGPALFILAASSLFNWIMAIEQVPQIAASFLLDLTQNKYIILFIVNLFLLFIGTFLPPIPAMILLIPILDPLMDTLGIHPIHFGVVMILNLMIGLLTPPVGPVLYVLVSIAKLPFEEVARSVWVFILPLIFVLFLITYIPDLVLFIPGLMIK